MFIQLHLGLKWRLLQSLHEIEPKKYRTHSPRHTTVPSLFAGIRCCNYKFEPRVPSAQTCQEVIVCGEFHNNGLLSSLSRGHPGFKFINYCAFNGRKYSHTNSYIFAVTAITQHDPRSRSQRELGLPVGAQAFSTFLENHESESKLRIKGRGSFKK